MRNKTILAGVLGLSLLAACGEREVILPGERLGARDVLQDADQATVPVPENQTIAIKLPAATRNASWAQSPVSPFARTGHPQLGTELAQVFAASIGQGDQRRARIVTDPVVADGRVFTMDSAGLVAATSTSGERIWSFSVAPLRDDPSQAPAGGLALDGGRLYVTSGFGTVTALNAATGEEIWTQRLGNTATGAPTVYKGLVYVVSGDSTAWAIETDNGRVRWTIDGVGDVGNVLGAPAPAVDDTHVVFSFGNGAVQAAFRQGGLRLWSADIVGSRRGFAISLVDDITGDPVIDGDTVYVGNHSGRLVALDVANGDRLWTAASGALGPVWVAGGSVFFVSDLNQLVRVSAEDGQQIWAVDLPGYVPKRKPQKKRRSSYVNYGPVLAGGRLIVASSDGLVRSFDPASGEELSQFAIKGGATTAPVIADGTLYLVSGKGVLHAYR